MNTFTNCSAQMEDKTTKPITDCILALASAAEKNAIAIQKIAEVVLKSPVKMIGFNAVTNIFSEEKQGNCENTEVENEED